MATLRTVTVGPGKDYSSLSNAEAGEQNDLVSLDRQLDIVCYAMLDTASVTIIGWTTGPTQYVNIYTAPGNRHAGVWDEVSYRLKQDADFNRCMTISEDYVRVTGILFQNMVMTGNGREVVYFNQISSSLSYVLLDSCIVRNSGGSGGQPQVAAYSGRTTIRNCLVYGGTGIGINVGDFQSATITVENCTVVNNVAYGLNRGTSSLTVKNTYSGGNGTNDFNGTMTRTNCMHSSATVFAGSTGSVPYSTANFVNVTPGSEDLHLASGSALIGAGADLSGTFTNDIDGETRVTPWDIGADQSASSGPVEYEMEADPGAFSLNGGQADLVKGYRMVAEPGSFAMTGGTATLVADRKLIAEQGLFSITGGTVDMTKTSKMIAEPGVFILTMATAEMKYGMVMTAESGSFVLTGGDVTLNAGLFLQAESGIFTVTGGSVEFLRSYRLEAGAGAFTITTGEALLNKGFHMEAEAGTFTLIGGEAEFPSGMRLSAEPGVFTLTGGEILIHRHYFLSAEPGIFIVTGGEAVLDKTGEFIVGGKFIAAQVYFPGFKNVQITSPGFRQSQVD